MRKVFLSIFVVLVIWILGLTIWVNSRRKIKPEPIFEEEKIAKEVIEPKIVKKVAEKPEVTEVVKVVKPRTKKEEKEYQERLANYRESFKRQKNYKSDSYKRTPANRNWYDGGTLHRAGVLTWQESDYKNKLATCADFIAATWQSENFKSSIQDKIKTVDDMLPYAFGLVTCLDAASEKHPDPETNYTMYTNQTVAEMATMCMIMMGWMR